MCVCVCVHTLPGRSQIYLLMTVRAEMIMGEGSDGEVGVGYRNPGDVVCSVFALTFD